MTDHPPPPCIHQGHTVRKSWVIVREPGRIPETKSPMKPTWEGVETLIRELIECRPEGTQLILARLSYGYDLWTEDAREWLRIGEAMKTHSCADCHWFEADQEDGNEGQGEWYQVCRARNGVSNLKSFPFKNSNCAEFKRKK